MLDTTLSDQVQGFLDDFGTALSQGDIDAACDMFQDDCYWRDLVSFTWNIKTVEGKAQVADMLAHQLATTKPSGWKIAEGEVPTEDGGLVDTRTGELFIRSTKGPERTRRWSSFYYPPKK